MNINMGRVGRIARRIPRAISSRRGAKVLSAFAGVALAGTGAYAATNWVVGLSSSSSGQAQSATISNLTITAAALPAPTNQLFPGATGDVVVSITNPNSAPVTITAIALPANTSYAAGYTNSGLTTAATGCSAATSLVTWNYATAASGTVHTLTTPITVAANNSASPLLLTLTNDATMGLLAPVACEGAYFSMPSLTAVTASAGAATATTSPATDSWTS